VYARTPQTLAWVVSNFSVVFIDEGRMSDANRDVMALLIYCGSDASGRRVGLVRENNDFSIRLITEYSRFLL